MMRANRRTALQWAGWNAAGWAAAGWLTPVAESLALAEEQSRSGRPRSVILLWLAGGPSQLETFDPHPGKSIAGDTRAIDTAAPGVRIAADYEQVAAEMQSIALVRSVVSKEGDHERATYNLMTGFRPVPALVHPSLGAIVCHQLQDRVEIPRHVSILDTPWPARGGFLGDQFDAFQIDDPVRPIPDVRPRAPELRAKQRVDDLLNVVEGAFSRGRMKKLDEGKTLHGLSVQAALRMMSSEQLAAFDVSQESASLRAEYGDSAFGRGCLAAVRLIGVGVRCVEVTLRGWDTHANNHSGHTQQAKLLDPAFAALLRDLRRRDLLDQTIVVCCGEFGRTPRINPAGGRDHWPHGFTVALAGGGIRGGTVVGATNPEPKLDEKNREQDLAQPVKVERVHATILQALGIDFRKQHPTPIGRPMSFSEGSVIDELLS